MSAVSDRPLSVADSRLLFDDLADAKVLILAVSGGPDSTALLWLMARWRSRRRKGPALIAVTVDHGLRPEARREALMVKRLARSLGVAHRTLKWNGEKPTTGLQARAREARYSLLAQAARKAGAHHVLTAHTRDDQAETVLIRLARGSGVSGLAAMARSAPWPCGEGPVLLRPLLDVPKSQLIATLRKAKVAAADDPSNANSAFTRVRMRQSAPLLAGEGLTAQRLVLLAARARRADLALEAITDNASRDLAPPPWHNPIAFSAAAFRALPAEIGLRLLGRAITAVGDEGPVELAKLEALYAALTAATGRFRRTLAGGLVTLANGHLTVERAPRRHGSAAKAP